MAMIGRRSETRSWSSRRSRAVERSGGAKISHVGIICSRARSIKIKTCHRLRRRRHHPLLRTPSSTTSLLSLPRRHRDKPPPPLTKELRSALPIAHARERRRARGLVRGAAVLGLEARRRARVVPEPRELGFAVAFGFGPELAERYPDALLRWWGVVLAVVLLLG